jgi:hypothetical protein
MAFTLRSSYIVSSVSKDVSELLIARDVEGSGHDI